MPINSKTQRMDLNVNQALSKDEEKGGTQQSTGPTTLQSSDDLRDEITTSRMMWQVQFYATVMCASVLIYQLSPKDKVSYALGASLLLWLAGLLFSLSIISLVSCSRLPCASTSRCFRWLRWLPLLNIVTKYYAVGVTAYIIIAVYKATSHNKF